MMISALYRSYHLKKISSVVIALLLLTPLLTPTIASAQTVYTQDFNACPQNGSITGCDANIVPFGSGGGGSTENGSWLASRRSDFFLDNHTWHNVCFSFDVKQVPNSNGPSGGEFALNMHTREASDLSTFDNVSFANNSVDGLHIANNTRLQRVDPSLRQSWNTLKLCSVENVSTTWFNNQRFGKSAAQNDLTARVGWQMFFADVDNLRVEEIPTDQQAPYTSANLAPSVGTITLTSQENSQVALSAPVSDDMDDTLSATWNWGDGNTTTGTVNTTFWPATVAGSHSYSATGTYTVTLTVTDQAGASDTNTFQVVVTSLPNNPPAISPLPNTTVNEGGRYTAAGNFTDPDSASWTATVDYGDGAGPQPLSLSGSTFSLNHDYQDNGAYTVTVSVTDNQGATDTEMATVTVANVNPSVGVITASVNPVQVNTALTASAPFTDAGVLDTHTAVWNWGDGTTSTGTVTEANGSGSVSDSHTYTQAGVYEITLMVTDTDGGAGTKTYQYLSVYSPTPQGLFSAGQKYTSSAGAYPENPTATGNVLFGLSYKYQGDVPAGSRQFTMDFQVADFKFNATSVSSLVIANGVGTLRGTGVITGRSGDYDFLVVGKEGTDTIRIQIKDQAGTTIYDTQPGAADTAEPTTAVTAGNVLAH